MLEANVIQQLETYLKLLKHPLHITATIGSDDASLQMQALLKEIQQCAANITLDFNGNHEFKPSFGIARVVNGQAEAPRVHFAGIPLGHEFTSLLLALLHVGGHPPKIDAEQIQTIQTLAADQNNGHFTTVISLSCHNCPDVVQAFNTIAALNPNFTHTMVDGALFQQWVEAKNILAVPSVFKGKKAEEPFGSGRMSLEEILSKIDTHSSTQEAAKLNARNPFDVLIVGGGPAGAAAAIYAARKGVQTGIVTQRFGGQVLDTLGIENFISVQETEGPRLVAQLEQHVKSYHVDIMTLQQAKGLQNRDGLVHVELENGATLKSKTVILSTGARWRELNVPGEQTYKNRGVAYCPHCDGPLFKGKKVAVIGGGNSGVEAAIDLAGIVAHVTLLEFGEKLRADAVLQNKLKSLNNVTIITQAQTTEVVGNGKQVTALQYLCRKTNTQQTIELDGVFVQIGLLPNTDWLKGKLELSAHGEIIVDEKGQTSMNGVFAAGDCTTTPYKQIIIAMGEGSKAALSAFDHLIRH